MPPLEPGKGKKKHKKNMQELLRSYKSSGMIGTSKPKNLHAAVRQANAIAYSKEDES